MTLIESIIDVIVSIITAFFGAIAEGLNELTAIFITTSETGAFTGMTFWGTLVFIGLGLTLMFFVISWVRSMIASRS